MVLQVGNSSWSCYHCDACEAIYLYAISLQDKLFLVRNCNLCLDLKIQVITRLVVSATEKNCFYAPLRKIFCNLHRRSEKFSVRHDRRGKFLLKCVLWPPRNFRGFCRDRRVKLNSIFFLFAADTIFRLLTPPGLFETFPTMIKKDVRRQQVNFCAGVVIFFSHVTDNFVGCCSPTRICTSCNMTKKDCLFRGHRCKKFSLHSGHHGNFFLLVPREPW